MKRFRGCAYSIAFILAFPIAIAASWTGMDKVWFWFGDCRDPKPMQLEVQLAGKQIYQSHFHACRMDFSSANGDEEQKHRLSFRFVGGESLAKDYGSKKAEMIKVDIWQAGVDPGDMLLGVTLETRDRELLNTIHIVKPGEATESNLGSELVLKTYPSKSRSENRIASH